MLHDFLVTHRREILERSQMRLAERAVPTPTEVELKHGLPIFLDQLAGILRGGKRERDASHREVLASATLHGGELLRLGLTVGQVVHDYGSIVQSVMELAAERGLAFTAEEFQTFNRCLDEAIAQAVTEYQLQRDRSPSAPGLTHLAFLAHEMRNLLTTSMLTFAALGRSNVGVQGSTGTILGRSLRGMRVLIDRTLAEVRLGAEIPRPERVCVAELIEEIEVVATIEAKEHDVHLVVDRGSHDVAVLGDHQILASVLANLVQNAFKFTHRRGRITLRAHATAERVQIDVQDECGGLPPGTVEGLFQPFEQRGADRTGLGLGLAISLKGVQASGGEIRVRDLPGSGCVFTVDLPRAPAVS